MSKLEARWLGEFVGGPYDGMTLTSDGVEPPATIAVDQNSKKFTPSESGNGFTFQAIGWGKGQYNNVLSAVTIDGELLDLYSVWIADEDTLEDVETVDGRPLVRCKYEWEAVATKV